ncbi:MAG: YdcF family protein [Flavobacteriales bacterium]
MQQQMNGNLRCAFTISLLLLLAGCSINNPLKYYAAAQARKPYDAVIVPGVPYDGVYWDPIMKGRVHWAVLLYKKGLTKNIIFSGAAVYTPYVEAEVMSLYAQQLGVPKEHCLLDPRAEHSTENLFYGWKVARDKGFTKVGLATDPFQAKMTRSFAKKMHRKLGADLDLIPIVSDTLDMFSLITPTIDPTTARVDSFISIYDREGFWKRFRGTLGKNVDWKAP